MQTDTQITRREIFVIDAVAEPPITSSQARVSRSANLCLPPLCIEINSLRSEFCRCLPPCAP